MADRSDPWAEFVSRLPPALAGLHMNPPADALPLPDGREVSLAQLVDVLREQTADLPQPTRPLLLHGDLVGAPMLAAAWRHITFRQARAVLALFDVGLLPEAQANARACLEHAVLLRRLALAADDGTTESLLEQLAADQQKRQLQHLKYLDALDAAGGGQHRTLLEEARRQHEANPVASDAPRRSGGTVAGHFRAIPDGEHFHSVYGRLSENTHAGLSSAVPFLFRPLTTGEPVSAHPESVPWAEALALVCWGCWAADDAMRRFLPDGDDRARRHVHILASVGIVEG